MTTPKHKVLFILTNTQTIGPNNRPSGYEFSEVARPYLSFIANEIDVDFATIQGGQPPEDGFNPDDAASVVFRGSVGFEQLNNSIPLHAINPDDYDAVFFPGGLGPMVDLLDDPTVNQTIAHFADTNRIIGAVCHGPAALLNVTLADGSPLLHNKRVAAFTTAEEIGHSEHDVPFMLDQKLESQGALHSAAPPFAPHVVVDGQLVTGQNPASAAGVAHAMIARLYHTQT